VDGLLTQRIVNISNSELTQRERDKTLSCKNDILSGGDLWINGQDECTAFVPSSHSSTTPAKNRLLQIIAIEVDAAAAL